MLVEKFLSLEIFIWRDHYVIEVTVSNLQIAEIADITLGSYLRSHCYIADCSQFALFHKAELLRMIITPFERPTLLLLKLKNTASLRIDL